MFEDRMTEDLVWIQLDLDTISHDVSTHGLIIPICHQIEVWSIDKLLERKALRCSARNRTAISMFLSIRKYINSPLIRKSCKS